MGLWGLWACGNCGTCGQTHQRTSGLQRTRRRIPPRLLVVRQAQARTRRPMHPDGGVENARGRPARPPAPVQRVSHTALDRRNAPAHRTHRHHPSRSRSTTGTSPARLRRVGKTGQLRAARRRYAGRLREPSLSVDGRPPRHRHPVAPRGTCSSTRPPTSPPSCTPHRSRSAATLTAPGDHESVERRERDPTLTADHSGNEEIGAEHQHRDHDPVPRGTCGTCGPA